MQKKREKKRESKGSREGRELETKKVVASISIFVKCLDKTNQFHDSNSHFFASSCRIHIG